MSKPNMTEIEWRGYWCGRPMEEMTKQELIEIIRRQHEDMQRTLRANRMRNAVEDKIEELRHGFQPKS
jgi:hypothetical protein